MPELDEVIRDADIIVAGYAMNLSEDSDGRYVFIRSLTNLDNDALIDADTCEELAWSASEAEMDVMIMYYKRVKDLLEEYYRERNM